MTVHGGAKGKGLSPLTVTTLFGVSPSSRVVMGICKFLFGRRSRFSLRETRFPFGLSITVAATPPTNALRLSVTVFADVFDTSREPFPWNHKS
jgi:hypothetical protein